MKTYRKAQSRFGSRMSERDFGELYSLLKFFFSIYATHEDEVKQVLEIIAEAYFTEYNCSDREAIEKLRNPRGAGRKKKLTEADKKRIQELRRAGHTIREIAVLTGISRSSVQRML